MAGARRGTGGRARRLVVLAAVLAALALAGVLGCDEPPRRRMLVIGIDGASPAVAFPMLAEGRLPNLAAIAEAGVHGELRSVLPLFSPRIWNTIATGRPAEDHGVFGFVKKQADETKQLYLSHDRKVPAIWNILSAAGHRVGVVNFWTTYPPERIDGVMVSDHFFPEQIAMIRRTFQDSGPSGGARVHPTGWQPRAEALRAATTPALRTTPMFGDDAVLPHWVDRALLRDQFETDAAVVRVALGVIAEHDPDAMFVFLPGIDRVSHWLWGNLEPADAYPPELRPSDEARAGGAAALRRYYEYTDELIGLLGASYGPDDLVMVISDHGFEAGVSLMLLTGAHDTPGALDGVIFARGAGIAAARDAGPVGVLDVAPTLLAWQGVPVAREMPGRPAAFLGVPPETRAVSYDDLVIERLDAGASGQEDEIVEQLRALGYLEPKRLEAAEPGGEQSELGEQREKSEAGEQRERSEKTAP